jgi:hypothetical protein
MPGRNDTALGRLIMLGFVVVKGGVGAEVGSGRGGVLVGRAVAHEPAHLQDILAVQPDGTTASNAELRPRRVVMALTGRPVRAVIREAQARFADDSLAPRA